MFAIYYHLLSSLMGHKNPSSLDLLREKIKCSIRVYIACFVMTVSRIWVWLQIIGRYLSKIEYFGNTRAKLKVYFTIFFMSSDIIRSVFTFKNKWKFGILPAYLTFLSIIECSAKKVIKFIKTMLQPSVQDVPCFGRFVPKNWMIWWKILRMYISNVAHTFTMKQIIMGIE